MSTNVTDLEPFRQGLFLRSPFRLRGSRCSLCAHVAYPMRPYCPRCRRDDAAFDEVELSPRGEIHTFTVVHQAPPGVPVPYVLAQVLLPEGCRVMAQCVAPDGHEFRIGDRVELEPVPFSSPQGPDVLGYRFRIIEEVQS
jgi:uncharacterized protein